MLNEILKNKTENETEISMHYEIIFRIQLFGKCVLFAPCVILCTLCLLLLFSCHVSVWSIWLWYEHVLGLVCTNGFRHVGRRLVELLANLSCGSAFMAIQESERREETIPHPQNSNKKN